MKKIGRQVAFLASTHDNPRNGEGDFIRLKDGKILYAFTEYRGGDGGDHAPAGISAILSEDEGETWGSRRVLVPQDEYAVNYMSISLLRMNNGDIGMFYLRKTPGILCKLYLTRSSDEMRTWSAPVCCTEEDAYFVVNNDRILPLPDGRLLFPASRHALGSDGIPLNVGKVCVFESCDDGVSWRQCSQMLEIPFDNSTTGLQEPGLYAYPDGTLWMWQRTGFGSQYESFSNDGGRNWTLPRANEFFTSPPAPMQVADAGKYTLAIFNPTPNYTGRDISKTWGRTPLVCAVSEDRAKTFSRIFLLEDDPSNGYCYPAVFAGDDYFLVAYYHSGGTGRCLSCAKIIKIHYDELH